MGATRGSLVIVEVLWIFVLAGLTRQVQEVRDGDRRGLVDRVLEDQQQPSQRSPALVTPPPVISMWTWG